MQNQPSDKTPIAYRAYNFPKHFPAIAFLGNSWVVDESQIKFLHFHNCIEIGFCFSGSGNIHLSNSSSEYSQNSFSVIFNNVPHMTTSAKPSNWEYIYFSPQELLEQFNFTYQPKYLAAFSVQTKPINVTKSNSPELYCLLEQLFTEFHRKELLYEFAIKGLLLAILPYLSNANICKAEHIYGYTKLETVFDCLSYIHENYNKALTIPYLSQKCYLSETHFRRVFKEIIGIPPQEYIILYRIRQACHLFFTSQDSIQNISSFVGFATLSSFNRQFQKFMNMSPSAWIKQNSKLATIHEVRSPQELAVNHVLR